MTTNTNTNVDAYLPAEFAGWPQSIIVGHALDAARWAVDAADHDELADVRALAMLLGGLATTLDGQPTGRGPVHQAALDALLEARRAAHARWQELERAVEEEERATLVAECVDAGVPAEAVEAWLDNQHGVLPDGPGEIVDGYMGRFDDVKDFAADLAESNGYFEALEGAGGSASWFDLDAYWNDLRHDLYDFDLPDGTVAIFRG